MTFHCNYDTLVIYLLRSEVYRCRPEISFEESEATTLESVTGSHWPGRRNSDVEDLNVQDQNLTAVPNNIDEFFPNLKSLSIWHSNLMTITADDLKFPSLLMIGIWNNPLLSLDGNLFASTPNLFWIDFSSNQIEHVGQDLLKNLNALIYANFINNPCISHLATSRDDVLRLNDQLPEACPAAENATVINYEDLLEETGNPVTETASEPDPTCSERVGFLEGELTRLEEEIVQLNDQIFQESRTNGSFSQKQCWSSAFLSCLSTFLNAVLNFKISIASPPKTEMVTSVDSECKKN